MPTITNANNNAGSGMLRRLCWFAGLWAAGVVSTGAVAMLIRWVLHA